MDAKQQLQALLKLPKYEQKSKEWFAQRENKVTASSASSLLIRDYDTCIDYIKQFDLDEDEIVNDKCCNPYSSKKQYIIDKCENNFTGNIAVYWGVKYEQVVTDLYAVNFNTHVHEFGMIEHPEYKWLGASPDGITEEGVMIEIKCPYRRKITGITPLYYYIQVQLQLEICNLEYCDYVEYSFIEYATLNEFVDDNTLNFKPLEKGLLIEISTHLDVFDNRSYIYPPKDIIKDISLLQTWEVDTINKYITDNDLTISNSDEETILYCTKGVEEHPVIIRTIYWKVDKCNIKRIKRSKEWFEYVKPVLKKGHSELSYYKQDSRHMELKKPKRKFVIEK